MNFLKAILGAAAFLALYGLVDWLAGVTAPVLGPIVLTALLVAPIWLLVRIYRSGM
jgi:hypothetical protein